MAKKSLAPAPVPLRSLHLLHQIGPASAARFLIVLVLALLPCFFLASPLEHFEFPKVTLFATVALLLLGLGMLAKSDRLARLHDCLRDPLCLGVLLFLASAALSTLTSVHPATSWRGEHGSSLSLLTILCYGVLFFAVRFSCRDWDDARPVLLAWMLGAACCGLYALLQFLGLDPLRWEDASTIGAFQRPGSTLGHANHVGALLAMTLPLSTYFLVQAIAQRRRAFALTLGLLAVVFLIVLLATLSRASWLALAAASLVGATSWLGLRTAALHKKTILAAAAVCVLLVTAFAWWNPGGVVTSLTHRLTNTESGHSRLALWQVSWSVFRSHPVFGCGPDALGLVFGEHRTPAQWRAETFTDATRAHNEILHVLATQGILGLAALLTILVGLLLACRRAWQIAPPQQRGLLLALFASLAAFLVVSAFSYTVVGYGAGFVAAAGLLSRLAKPQPDAALASTEEHAVAPTPTRFAAFRPAAAILVWLAIGLVWFLGVMQPFRASLAAAAGNALCRDNPVDALPLLERAVELQSGNDHLWLLLAGGQQAAAQQTPSGSRRLTHLNEARQALEHAQGLNPRRASLPLNLAKVRAQLAAAAQAPTDDVWPTFEEALRRDPHNPAVHMEASLAALTLNDVARARQYAEAGLQLDPRFGPLLSQLGYLALREEKTADALELLLRAEQGRWIERLDWRVAALSNLAVAQSQLGQDAAAEYTLLQALSLAPQAQPLRLFRAQILERLGRAQDALQEYARILDLAPDHPQARRAIERAGPIRRVSQ